MGILKKILAFVLAAGALGYFGYRAYVFSLAACDRPIKYAIGRFDTDFKIPEESFKTYLKDAEAVWEKPLGKEVFQYDENAEFKVNLVYDERQLTTVQKRKTEFGLEETEHILKKLDDDFAMMERRYDAKVASHENASKTFEKKQKEYESKVDYWNSHGGAPKNEYDALQAESKILNAEASRLNAEAATLNREAEELNDVLERRNDAAKNYNRVAANYNSKYGHGLEFDQAEYTGDEINIYQFENKNDLVLALAHEFGHALQMDHVENPNSIMYYITNSTEEKPLVLSAEDTTELNRVCRN